MAVPEPVWIASSKTRNLSRRTSKVRLIVVHTTGGKYPYDLQTLLGWTPRRVSVDIYIPRTFRAVYKLNPQLSMYYTWHAGLARWKGVRNVNAISIGIELEGMGAPYPEDQLSTLVWVAAWLCERYKLDPDKAIVGHRDVAWPRGRKTDPANFPWDEFRERVGDMLKL